MKPFPLDTTSDMPEQTLSPKASADCSPAPCSPAWLAAKERDELAFLRLEAENMALTLEALGYGDGRRLCTPLGRYRDRYPKRKLENKESLNQLIERLQKIAVKNHDEFRYKIEITPRRVGGTDYQFICQENAEGHSFLIGSGGTIDAAVADANNSVLDSCEEWGYTP